MWSIIHESTHCVFQLKLVPAVFWLRLSPGQSQWVWCLGGYSDTCKCCLDIASFCLGGQSRKFGSDTSGNMHAQECTRREQGGWKQRGKSRTGSWESSRKFFRIWNHDLSSVSIYLTLLSVLKFCLFISFLFPFYFFLFQTLTKNMIEFYHLIQVGSISDWSSLVN